MATIPKTEPIASKGTEEPKETDVITKPIPAAQRKIPGNLPYLTASGTLKKALDGLIEAARPPKFNSDFMENVLKLTGGAARATIPILKRMEFLASDGTPTDLYGRFRTESGRPSAALSGLRSAFPEIFKRSEYAHSVEDAKIRDIVMEITGLKPNDKVAMAIRSTFNVVRSYIPNGMDISGLEENGSIDDQVASTQPLLGSQNNDTHPTQRRGMGLVYNINIVLPETSDLKVLNAIFRSLKENLLQ